MTAPDDLLQALFQRLKSDAKLTVLLGGAGLLERPTGNAAFPYVTCGHTSAFDLDTGADNDADQLVTLHGDQAGRDDRRAGGAAGQLGSLHQARLT